MILNVLRKRMTTSIAAVMSLFVLGGAAPSVQAKVTESTKAVQITDVGKRPFVLDDKGNGWGLSVSSRAYRMNLLPNRGNLFQVENINHIVSIVSNRNFGIALKDDGTVWTVDSDESSDSQKDKWGEATPKLGTQVPNLEHIVKICSFHDNVFAAVDKNGKMWVWEDIPAFAKTTELQKYQSRPLEGLTLVKSIDHIKDISPSLILKDDGTVWTWEYNHRENNMLASIKTQNPVQVQGLTDIVKLGQGNSYDHIVLKKDGTVWLWGAGYLSDPKFDGGKDEQPAPVKGLNDVVDLAIGGNHVIALKKDGTVWTFGYIPKKYVETVSTLSPSINRPLAQVEGLSDVAAVFAGEITDAVIKKDGTLWMWGYDEYGLFGQEWSLQLEPVQVQLKPYPNTSRK